jgi:CRISPR/Cas system-associated exonuclease Cas4 (RecB family)
MEKISMSITQPVYLGELHKCHQCSVMCNFSASDAYQYMQCARKLFYDKQRGFRTVSPELQGMFTKGKQEHDKVKALLKIKFKNIQFEQAFTKKISNYILHGHADSIVTNQEPNLLIEIKGLYRKGAYMQTLMYRLLAPDYIDIYLAEYINKKGLNIFPLQADLTMAKVYFARLVTASKILAPRLPKYPDAFNCKNCDVKDQCNKDINYAWNTEDIKNIYKRHESRVNPLHSLQTFRELANQTFKEIFV